MTTILEIESLLVLSLVAAVLIVALIPLVCVIYEIIKGE
jgi:hypothetical protein